MSIHKSKGLEFPVVILADIGKQFNLTDIQNPVLFHKKLGLGLYLNDARHHVRYQTLSRQAIVQQIIRENKAEEMRVLYVAMTRAREKLIMTGSVRDFAKFAAYCAKQTNSSDRILPEHIITNARSYLDWIGPALARHPDGLPLRNSSDNAAATLLKDSSSWQISFIDKISDLTEPAEHDQADEILNTVKNYSRCRRLIIKYGLKTDSAGFIRIRKGSLFRRNSPLRKSSSASISARTNTPRAITKNSASTARNLSRNALP